MACTPISLVGVGLDCGSVGGLSVIYIIDKANVSTVTLNASNEVSGITLVSGTTFKTFNFRKNNANFASTGNRSDENGTLFYTTVLEAKFNKMETAKRTDMAAISAGNTYVIAKDNNGLYWLIGYSTLNTYVFGNTVGNTGAAMADANQYILTLTSDTPELPFQFVSGFNFTSLVS